MPSTACSKPPSAKPAATPASSPHPHRALRHRRKARFHSAQPPRRLTHSEFKKPSYSSSAAGHTNAQ
jgi:hypothetical protein